MFSTLVVMSTHYYMGVLGGNQSILLIKVLKKKDGLERQDLYSWLQIYKMLTTIHITTLLTTFKCNGRCIKYKRNSC